MPLSPAPESPPSPGSASTDARRPIRIAWILIAAATAFRMLYAIFYTFDLAGDEAYYWDWGRHLDWGYYSKPPLIAWLMRLVSEIGGSHTITIRLAAAALATGSLSFILLLTQSLFGNRAAFWAVLVSIAIPANVFLSAMLTIDAPLVFFWSASLFCFWRWFEGRQPVVWALLLAVALGLGYLSKQMMLVFPLLAIVFLFTVPDTQKRRARLRDPLFWAAIGVSLTFFIPNLLWNARHDWIMFAHTGGQITGAGDTTPFGLSFLEFLGTQAGMFSPLIWFLITVAVFWGLFGFRKLGERERFLVLFSAPAFVVMYLMSLGRAMLPNWPAVYYVSAIVLTAGWIAEAAAIPKLRDSFRRLSGPSVVLGLILVAAVYLLPLILDLTGASGHQQLDPFRRVRGHQQSALQAAKFFEHLPHPDKTFVIAQGHRYHASHLSFYLPGQPRVYRWERYDEIASQYELWPNPIDDGLEGWDAIIFVPDRERNVPFRFQGAFKSFERLGEFAVEVSPHYEKYYQVYLGNSLVEWPEPMLREEIEAEN